MAVAFAITGFQTFFKLLQVVRLFYRLNLFIARYFGFYIVLICLVRMCKVIQKEIKILSRKLYDSFSCLESLNNIRKVISDGEREFWVLIQIWSAN